MRFPFTYVSLGGTRVYACRRPVDLLRGLADRLRLEQIGRSAQTARQGRADGALSTWSFDGAAHPPGRGVALARVESDEEGSHRSVIEHVDSPFGFALHQDVVEQRCDAYPRSSNTCRRPITISNA